MHYVTKVTQWFWERLRYIFAMDVCDINKQPHIGIVLNATNTPIMDFALNVSPKKNHNMVIHNDN